MYENTSNEITSLLKKDEVEEAICTLLDFVEKAEIEDFEATKSLIVQSATITSLKKDIQLGKIDWEFNRNKRNNAISIILDINNELLRIYKQERAGTKHLIPHTYVSLIGMFESLAMILT